MFNALFGRKFDQDEYQALLWKRPDSIEVLIKESDEGYFAKLTNFTEDNVVTEAKTGQELVIMVNEAMYDYLGIPDMYRASMGYFMPSEEDRAQIKAKIPAKYLNKTLSLARS